MAAQRMGCAENEVDAQLDSIRDRFREGGSLRTACDEGVGTMLEAFPQLVSHRDDLLRIVRRYMRADSFLVRFFPLEARRGRREDFYEALDTADESGMTLRTLLMEFFRFLVERCSVKEREDYIEALRGIQPRSTTAEDVAASFGDDEVQGAERRRLLANVRLANGNTAHETRQRLMLTFNTPFYPDVLIASTVMAEGVDLHRNCQHVIHHDLCWNPSTLEQRTGRVDRIGAKAELSRHPIHVYIPYVAETQDEKMYRVVMDREQWFKVVMGEKLNVSAKATDVLAERLPLPESIANKLALRLEVVPQDLWPSLCPDGGTPTNTTLDKTTDAPRPRRFRRYRGTGA